MDGSILKPPNIPRHHAKTQFIAYLTSHNWLSSHNRLCKHFQCFIGICCVSYALMKYFFDIALHLEICIWASVLHQISHFIDFHQSCMKYKALWDPNITMCASCCIIFINAHASKMTLQCRLEFCMDKDMPDVQAGFIKDVAKCIIADSCCKIEKAKE